MKDITAEDRAALRILIGAAVYAVKQVPGSKPAERIKDAMQHLAPYAFGMPIVGAETSNEDGDRNETSTP